jgi:hypothetical protein
MVVSCRKLSLSRLAFAALSSSLLLPLLGFGFEPGEDFRTQCSSL